MKISFQYFSSLIPINALAASYRKELVRFTSVEAHKAGDILFRQGQSDKAVYYLYSGEVELSGNSHAEKIIRGGTETAKHPLSNRQPRPATATVLSDQAVFLKVSRRQLDKVLAWEQVAEVKEPEDRDGSILQAVDDKEWMGAMLATQAFLQLPSANISSLFSALEPVSVKAGDVIVKQGDPGDFYYMIKSGKCRVSRDEDGQVSDLAELSPCDSFGEEALVSGAPRNATVTMLTDGVLMRLAKDKFTELLKAPLIRTITPDEAAEMLKGNAKRVDVRLESEYKYDGLKTNLNIPLNELRQKALSLDPLTKYIMYCDTGERSAAAAFIMGSMGFDVYLLKAYTNIVVEDYEGDF